MVRGTVIALVLVVTAVAVGYFSMRQDYSSDVGIDQELEQLSAASSASSIKAKNNSTVQKKSLRKVGLFGQLCEGSGSFKLRTFPLDVQHIELITPMGRVQDSHVRPTDHQYVIPKGTVSGSLVTNEPKKYEIRAPAKGHIINVELFREPVEAQYRTQEYRDNYLVIFEHSCNFYTRLIHIDTLTDRILHALTFRNPTSQHPYAFGRVPVAEGEVIGTVGPHSFDFQLVDTSKKNPRIISPGKIDNLTAYTQDTFAYLASPLREELLKKNMRTKAPFGGDVGMDYPGTLAGNWFRVGRITDRDRKPDYWSDELSVVYDHLDPSQIRVSLGHFDGYPKAFGVKGNAPDPKKVRVGSGAVKYELVTFDYFVGGVRWDTLHFASDIVANNLNEFRGTVLFELVDNKTLRAEVFSGKTAPEVSGFSDKAILYER